MPSRRKHRRARRQCSGRPRAIRHGHCRGCGEKTAASGASLAHLAEVWDQLEEQDDREPYDVKVVTLDRAHQRRPATLDRVAARTIAPFAGRDVALDLGGGEIAE